LEISSLSSPDLRKQIAIVRETLYPDGWPASFGMIARLLMMAKATVAEYYTRYVAERRDGPRPPGGPRRLTRAIEEAITVKVIASFESKMACIYWNLTDFVFESFGVTLNNQLVPLTVKRNEAVKVFSVYPMEDARVECPPSEIDAHFALLAWELQRLPASLLCNLEEMGWAEYQDAEPITVVVPAYCPDELPYPVDRTRRRLTVLHCIFADGSYAIPFIITSQKTIDHEVFQKGYTREKVMIRFQENALITQSLFIEWASVVLFQRSSAGAHRSACRFHNFMRRL
jgi:hypothetical protein